MRKMILAAILLLSMSPAMAAPPIGNLPSYELWKKILLVPYALAEFYRTTCESRGGEYVENDPNDYQKWSCV